MTPTERAETLKALLIGYAVDGDEVSRDVLADFIEEHFGHPISTTIRDETDTSLHHIASSQVDKDKPRKSRWWKGDFGGRIGSEREWTCSHVWYLLDQDVLLPFSEDWFKVTA